MTTITLKGNPIETVGTLPAKGQNAPGFTLVNTDLSEVTLESLKGKRVVLNIFPSVDTPTCAMSIRKFNEQAAKLNNTQVICVSADLPFACARFCGAENIDNVIAASSFRSSFANDYQVKITTGPLAGLLSRAVVVVDEKGAVLYSQQVPEIADEPDYDAAIASLA